MTLDISIAYTPDPDDAFHYHALEAGRIAAPAGCKLSFTHAPIQALNESCRRQVHDVCAISSVHYPAISDDYVILASGASVGRGYGPGLAAAAGTTFDSLVGRRVAIPGELTTGNFLLRYFYRGYAPVVLPFDDIAAAIVTGEVDAGVLIHEELLNYTEQPLRRICCLGARWFEHTGLPLPVGLNVARRALGPRLIGALEDAIHASMRHALDHYDEAMAFASRFGRGPQSLVREDFVARFANTDTLLMPADVREGLATLYARAVDNGFIARVPPLDLVDPSPGAAPRAVANG
ncbi:MAG: MqnA/MqnD/SBP family protein [Gammaproteobacteria bacterium]